MPAFPLTTANRNTLVRAYRHHARVDMGIDCVLEGQTGRVQVDDPYRPAVFLLLVSDFFSAQQI